MAGRGQGSGRGSTCYRINVGFEPDEAASPGNPHGAPGNACVSPASGPQQVHDGPMRAGHPPFVRTRRSQVILVPVSVTAIREGAGPVAARQCTGRPPCRRIRRFRRILPDAPGDLPDRPVALPAASAELPGLTLLKRQPRPRPRPVRRTMRAHRARVGRAREPERLVNKLVVNKTVDNRLVDVQYSTNLSNKGAPAMKSSTARWVSGDDFFDREPELQVLESRARDRNHLLLSGERRMGKTSILRELGRRLEERGWDFLCWYSPSRPVLLRTPA